MKTLIQTIFLFLISIDTASANPIINLSIVNDACNSGTGSITAYISSGIPPYSVVWNPTNQTTTDIRNLHAGTYICFVTDAAGMTASATGVVNNDNFLDAGYNMDPASGFSINGKAYVFSRNGVHPIAGSDCMSFSLWPNGSYTDVLSPFSANAISCGSFMPGGVAYHISVVDANGCAVSFNDTMRAIGYATPTPTAMGACSSLANGQIWDTLKLHDDSLNFNWIIGSYSVYLYQVGNPIAIDQFHSVNYNPVYVFRHLAAGNYRLDYYVDGSGALFKSIGINVPDLGSNCGTVEGKIIVDVNKNCVVDFAEPAEIGAIVRIDPGGFLTNTDKYGDYEIALNLGTYTLQHTPVYKDILGVKCPVEPKSFQIQSGTSVILNLLDTSPGLDLSSHVGITTLRPGRSGSAYFGIGNISAIPATVDSVIFTYNPIIIPNSIYPSPDSVAPGYIRWSAQQFNYMAVSNYAISLVVPPNPLLIGTTITVSGKAYTNQADINLLNNIDSDSTVITGSYDPNHKRVSPAGHGVQNWLPLGTSELEYLVEFQNTGTDTAFKIVIVDTLDPHLDYSSFQPLAASNEYSWTIEGSGKVTFTFDNINLPDSGRNQKGSNGFIEYKVSPKSNLAEFDTIRNTAWIYFDFNPPIATNITSNKFYDCNHLLYPVSDSVFSCEFDNFQFAAPSVLAENVHWQLDGNNFGIDDTLQIFGQLPVGSHNISYEATTPYCSQVNSIDWIVYSAPLVNVIANGLHLSCSQTGVAYQWLLNGDSIQGATDSIFDVTANGIYSVIVTNADGCTSSSPPAIISSVDILETTGKSEINYWPNPVFDELHFSWPEGISECIVVIFSNQLGEVVYHSEVTLDCNLDTQTIKLPHVKEGIYHVQLLGKSNAFQFNVVKK